MINLHVINQFHSRVLYLMWGDYPTRHDHPLQDLAVLRLWQLQPIRTLHQDVPKATPKNMRNELDVPALAAHLGPTPHSMFGGSCEVFNHQKRHKMTPRYPKQIMPKTNQPGICCLSPVI